MSRLLARAGRALVLAAIPAALVGRPLHAQVNADKLSIHGYLTQGFGKSSDLPVDGVPSADATFELRTAALQFGYSITDRDQVTVQLRHRHLGSSPLQEVEPATAVHWAYYQHRFGTNTTVKVGELPIPRGIYNEIRAVGTLMPFFRAPTSVYLEGYETLGGASVRHVLPLGKSWSLDATGYVGGFDVDYPFFNALNNEYTLLELSYEVVRGGQLWLNTPVDGLRLGVGGMRFRSRKEDKDTPTPAASNWQASLDGNFGRVLARSEFNHSAVSGQHQLNYYAQLGGQLTEQFSLNVQHEVQEVRMSRGTLPYLEYRARRDMAVGGKYAFSPNVNVKLEQHFAKGYAFDTPIPVSGAARSTNYFIASLAASF